LVAVVLRQYAILLAEALGEIAAAGEAYALGDLVDATALAQQLGGTLQTLGLQILDGGDVRQGLDLAIEAGTTHVHLLGEDVDGEGFVAHVLVDELLQTLHEQQVLLGHAQLAVVMSNGRQRVFQEPSL